MFEEKLYGICDEGSKDRDYKMYQLVDMKPRRLSEVVIKTLQHENIIEIEKDFRGDVEFLGVSDKSKK